jgi:hypothetical protein
MTKGKKTTVDFLAGLAAIEHTNAVRRHPTAKTEAQAPAPAAPAELPQSLRISEQPSRRGKVAITHWVDPAVRKQLARLAIDYDSTQADLCAEALNLLFEKYGKPPIATHIGDGSTALQPTS